MLEWQEEYNEFATNNPEWNLPKEEPILTSKFVEKKPKHILLSDEQNKKQIAFLREHGFGKIPDTKKECTELISEVIMHNGEQDRVAECDELGFYGLEMSDLY